jgi:hypothetical protein
MLGCQVKAGRGGLARRGEGTRGWCVASRRSGREWSETTLEASQHPVSPSIGGDRPHTREGGSQGGRRGAWHEHGEKRNLILPVARQIRGTLCRSTLYTV